MTSMFLYNLLIKQIEAYRDHFILLGKPTIGHGDIFFSNDLFHLTLKFLSLKKNSFNSTDNLVSILSETCQMQWTDHIC